MSTRKGSDLVQKFIEGKIARREFVARGLALGLSFTTISDILAAYGNGGSAMQGARLAAAAQDDIVPEGNIEIWTRAGDLFQVFNNAIPAFNEKYPDINVNHTPVESDEVITTLASGANVPDGAFIEDENLGTIAPLLYDITERMEPYVDDLVGYKVRVNTHDGRIKGIPYDVDPGLMYYRADLLDEYGVNIDDIETYEDLIDAAVQLQGEHPDLRPIRIENEPGLIVLWVAMFANQQHTSYVDADGELLIESPPFLNIMNFLASAVDAGVANRVELFTPGDIAASDRGIQLFVPYAIWFNYGIENLLAESKGKWRATRLPAWEAGGTRAALMGGSSFVIPQKAESPELAWLFYEFMMLTPEGIEAAFGPNDVYAEGINTLIPSYKPVYDDVQLMGNPEGLGGQNLWELATSVAAEIPPNFYYPTWYSQMAPFLGANVQRLYDGRLSPEEVLERSAEEIRSNLMR